MQNTIVREYKSREAFERDAQKLAAEGYSVVSVTETQPRAGCIRILTLNLLALVWRPKPKLVVTYQRLAPPAP